MSYNYRQTLLTAPRIISTAADTISITASADNFVTNGMVITPGTIYFTAVLQGVLANAPASQIVWKKDGVVFSPTRTGTSMSFTVADQGYTGLSLATTISITATVSFAGIDQVATKTISLISPTATGSVSPSSASITTAADGSGSISQAFTMNISAGTADGSTGWTYQWSCPNMTPTSSTSKTVTITAMTVDSSTLTCTASKSGYSNIVASATLSKSKTGTSGTDGASTQIVYLRSASAPAKPTGTTNPPLTPVTWYSTVALATGTDPIYMSTGTKAAGAQTWVWNTPVLMQGQNGTPGASAKKVATGYVYWTGTAGSQGSPGQGTYTFSSGTISGMNSGWTQSITFDASQGNYACYFTVEETSAGSGSGTVVFGSVTTHTNFTGLVTFTNLNTQGATFINGDNITSGTITGRKIRTAVQGMRVEMENPGASYPHTFTGYNSSNGVVFRLTSNEYSGYGATLDIKAPQAQVPAIRAQGAVNAYDGSSYGYLAFTSTVGVYGFGTSTGVQADGSSFGMFGSSYSGQGGYFSGVEGIRAVHPRTDTGGQAIYAESSFGAGVYGIGTTHDFYAGGPGINYGPFTGQHDGILDTLSSAVIGDILVDISVLAKRNVSNTITTVSLSTIPNQKGTIGVLQDRYLFDLDNINIPSAFTNDSIKLDKYGDALYYAYALNWYKTNDPTASLDKNVDRVAFNALGEGQINVCGENGDLSIGDLIVTSSIPGKGMKQADDIVRSYTVAKCREAVTFSSPTEVKMVACIYLCG